MATITTRAAKGSALTHNEVDDNFANLNSAKLEFGQVQSAGTANGVPYLNASKLVTSGTALTFNGTKFTQTASTTGILAEFKNSASNAQDANISATNDAGTSLRVQVFGSAAGTYGMLSAGSPLLYTSASSLNFVADNASGAIKFGLSGSTEAMRLTSTGLGIGTSSPADKLSVYGDTTGLVSIKVTNNNATGVDKYISMFAGGTSSGVAAWNNSGVVESAVGTNLVFSGYNGTILFQTGTSRTERMRLDSSGNLGIGTTSPAYKLDVSGSVRISSKLLLDTGTAALPSLTFSGWVDTGIYNPTGTSLGFSTSGAEKMRLDSSGNLLVGQTSQTAPGVSNTTTGFAVGGSTGYIAASRASGTVMFLNRNSDGDLLNFNSSGVATYQLGLSSGALTFNNTSERMRLDASGRLGLGTTTQGTNPDQMYIVTKASSKYALHISHENVGSGAATVGAIRIDGYQGRGQGTNTGISINISEIDSGACTGINAKVTGAYSAQYAVYQEISKDLGAFTNAYCNYATMATTNSGGAAYFYYAYDQNSAAVKFYVGQNGGISNYQANNTNLSDRREKTNFAPAGDYLAKICAIPVQTFNYIDQPENDPGLTLGVVAQDVQDVAPELVMESNWGTEETPKMRLSIYQTDLQYALMKCVQEQQALIESLTQRLAALESK